MAAVPAMTVAENLLLGARENHGGLRAPDMGAAKARAAWLAEKFKLPMPRLDVKIGTLSGGNLQRLVIARELSHRPAVLFTYYPSRGLDVHATRIVHQVLRDCRNSGAAVVLIGEDLDELFMLSDRIAVMYHGAVAGIVNPESSDIGEVGALMTRGHHTPAEAEAAHSLREEPAWLSS